MIQFYQQHWINLINGLGKLYFGIFPKPDCAFICGLTNYTFNELIPKYRHCPCFIRSRLYKCSRDLFGITSLWPNCPPALQLTEGVNPTRKRARPGLNAPPRGPVSLFIYAHKLWKIRSIESYLWMKLVYPPQLAKQKLSHKRLLKFVPFYFSLCMYTDIIYTACSVLSLKSWLFYIFCFIKIVFKILTITFFFFFNFI